MNTGRVVLLRASKSASVVQLYCVEQSGSQDTQDGTGSSVKVHSPSTRVHSPTRGVPVKFSYGGHAGRGSRSK